MSEFPVKRYRFRFSPLMLALLLGGIALCFLSFGLTTWQFLSFLNGGDLTSVYDWIKFVLLYLVSVLLLVLVVAMLIRSEYVVNDDKLVMRFGLIKSVYDLKKVDSIHLFKGAGKLAVYFDDFKTKYIVIVVKEAWYDDFVKTLLERNDRIGFSFSTAEEEEEIKRKK